MTGFPESLPSDVKSKIYVSKNFKASNFVPTEPDYNIKSKQISGQTNFRKKKKIDHKMHQGKTSII